MFLDAPLGHTTGPPNDPAMQLGIVRRALELAAAMTEPGTIVDLDLRWHHDDWKSDPLGWTRRGEAAAPGGASTAPQGDNRTVRRTEPQYQTAADRVAAEATDHDEHCRTCIGLPVDP